MPTLGAVSGFAGITRDYPGLLGITRDYPRPLRESKESLLKGGSTKSSFWGAFEKLELGGFRKVGVSGGLPTWSQDGPQIPQLGAKITS